MSVTYRSARRARTGSTAEDRTERRAAHEDLASLLQHLDAFGVRLESLVVAEDGAITLTVSGKIPRDQLEHLGLDAASETEPVR